LIVLESVQQAPGGDSALERKVAFLGSPRAHAAAVERVICRETHMSWVFLAGDKAYKLKKPVRLPYLDFSTLARRELACRAEVRLNRRLAGDVYLGVVPLCLRGGVYSLGGPGAVVDWLVVMRRLDQRQMLDQLLARERLDREHFDRLASLLSGFYRTAARVRTAPDNHLRKWVRALAINREQLLDRRFALPASLVWAADRAQRRFLAERQTLLNERVICCRIVDGHGDLRPEHIWFGDSLRIIDCLEFNAELRAVDPMDDLAYLDLELELIGFPAAGEYIRRRVLEQLHDPAPEALFRFYRSQRAMLRARLVIAHLLEPQPRTPEKWPLLARRYLQLAAEDSRLLERSWFRTRTGRPKTCPRAAGESFPPKRAQRR
jgi:aminoglycoside phosphotransferase family enzyme